MCFAQGEQSIRLGETENLQRTPDLVAVLGERCQLRAFGVVTEKCVEQLLHVPQIGLDLASDLRQQYAFLRAFAHFVQHRYVPAGGEAALACRIEAREHGVDVLAEFRRQRRIIFERAFGEQQCRREFHRHWLADPGSGHLVQTLDQRGGQLHQRAVVHFSGLGVYRGKRLFQLRQVLGPTRSRLEPGILRAGQLFTCFSQQRLEPHDVGGQHFRRWNESGQLERALDGLHLWPHRRADRDEVEHFAPQSVRNLRTAFGHATDLQIDTRRQLLDAESAVQSAFDQTFVHGADRPPERAQIALRGHVFDAGNGIAHRCRARFVATQPGQQSALI